MLIAPAAPFVFEDFPRVLGYLRSRGVKAFYPVLPYADITMWAYWTILKANPQAKLISSACIGMNRYLEHHAEYAGYLSPVFSPLLCAARYLKTYRRLEGPFAFLSPCLLKENEFSVQNRERLVHYNITMDALKTRFETDAVDIRQYEPCSEETGQNGKGLTLAAFGGIGKTLAALLPDIGFHVEQGLGNAASYLSGNREFRESRSPSFIFEPYACKGGCTCGSGVGATTACASTDFLKCCDADDVDANTNRENIFNLFSYYDATLKLEDFCHW
jgi:iron only hydrogenase large subunit-like protein